MVKKKHVVDESTRYKSIVASKGCMQIPGHDYTERYLPVAIDTATRLVIVLCLYYGWKLESIDIEAAFLEGDSEEHMYMEWPPGMAELGQIEHEEMKSKCSAEQEHLWDG